MMNMRLLISKIGLLSLVFLMFACDKEPVSPTEEEPGDWTHFIPFCEGLQYGFCGTGMTEEMWEELHRSVAQNYVDQELVPHGIEVQDQILGHAECPEWCDSNLTYVQYIAIRIKKKEETKLFKLEGDWRIWDGICGEPN